MEILDKKVLKALGADARQEIVKHLSKRPYTASELARLMGKHVTTVTEHLQLLEESGLVTRNVGKKWVYYELSDRGSRLFKPNFYSWIVVFSLSAALVFTGFLRFFAGGFSAGAERFADMPAAPISAPSISPAIAFDFIALGLVLAGIAGFALVCFRLRLSR